MCDECEISSMVHNADVSANLTSNLKNKSWDDGIKQNNNIECPFPGSDGFKLVKLK